MPAIRYMVVKMKAHAASRGEAVTRRNLVGCSTGIGGLLGPYANMRSTLTLGLLCRTALRPAIVDSRSRSRVAACACAAGARVAAPPSGGQRHFEAERLRTLQF